MAAEALRFVGGGGEGMIYWKAELDPTEPPSWRIINEQTKKPIVFGLTERSAKELTERRNKIQEKKEKKKP